MRDKCEQSSRGNKKPKQSLDDHIRESDFANQQCISTERKGDAIIEKQKEQMLKNTISGVLKDIKAKFGIHIELDKFWKGMQSTFRRNGVHIGIMAAKIYENPNLVYKIISKRIKEFAIECADDPLKCAANIHGKAVDFVYNFMVKTKREKFKNFAYDMGQATGEAFLSLATVGTINVARLSYINPELKDPKDYPAYFTKIMKPTLNQYLSPKSLKQLNIFIQGLSKQISFISVKKLKELFEAMEQFAKDCEKGVASSVTTMRTLSRIFLDVTYSKMSSFDARPILQDMINIASHIKSPKLKDTSKRREIIYNKFITAIAKFSVDHNTSILKIYSSLQNQPKLIAERAVMDKSLDELIVFRCTYCKDINNQDFMDMMKYAKNMKIQTDDKRINQILNLV